LAGFHARYFLRLAERSEPELVRPEQKEWLDRLETDHDNLRAALDLCLNTAPLTLSALLLAGALWRFWDLRGYLTEGRTWLAEALQVLEPPKTDLLD
jgi:predicted ATPase